MRHAELRKLVNRNAVLVALNYLAGDNGIIVGTAATEIAPLAGRSVQITRDTLAELERAQVITRLGWRDGISCQIIVLMDRPGAMAFVRENRAIYGHHGLSSLKKGA